MSREGRRQRQHLQERHLRGRAGHSWSAALAIAVAQGAVTVDYLADTPEVLYLKAEVAAGDDTAYAIISGDYTNIVEVGRNGEVLVASEAGVEADEAAGFLTLEGLRLAELFALVEEFSEKELAFLVEAAVINRQAAEASLADPRLELGRALQAQAADDLPAPFAAIHRAQTLVSAASEARMAGATVPIMAVAGSGNQGINNFLGVLAVAEVLGSPLDAMARALAISSAVVALVKGYAARMTAFCGGAIAASCGVAAGTTYLLGGDATAADFMRQPRRLLEARREQLYAEMPVPENWHAAYARQETDTSGYRCLLTKLDSPGGVR